MFVLPSNRIQTKEKIFYTLTRVRIKMAFLILKKWLTNMDLETHCIQPWRLSLITIMTAILTCTSPLMKSPKDLMPDYFDPLFQTVLSQAPADYTETIGMILLNIPYLLTFRNKQE